MSSSSSPPISAQKIQQVLNASKDAGKAVVKHVVNNPNTLKLVQAALLAWISTKPGQPIAQQISPSAAKINGSWFSRHYIITALIGIFGVLATYLKIKHKNIIAG